MRRAILDPGAFIWTNLVVDHQARLHTEFQAPEANTCSSEEEEDVWIFLGTSMISISSSSGHEDVNNEVDQFYQQLQEITDQTPKKDILIVQVD